MVYYKCKATGSHHPPQISLNPFYFLWTGWALVRVRRKRLTARVAAQLLNRMNLNTDTYEDVSDRTWCPQTFPHLKRIWSRPDGREPAPANWQPSVNAGKPWPPLSLALFLKHTAHQLSGLTLAAPASALAAKVRMKGDTVIPVNAEGTYGTQQTLETCLVINRIWWGTKTTPWVNVNETEFDKLPLHQRVPKVA